jgi:hypothetical protein
MNNLIFWIFCTLIYFCICVFFAQFFYQKGWEKGKEMQKQTHITNIELVKKETSEKLAQEYLTASLYYFKSLCDEGKSFKFPAISGNDIYACTKKPYY